jgi:ATP-dependent Lon protease
MSNLNELEKLMIQEFPQKIVMKSYAQTINSLKALPIFVSEYLISRFASPTTCLLHPDAEKEIKAIVTKNTPDKSDKEVLKSTLNLMGNLELIDHYIVHTDLKRGKYFAQIPALDERATVNRDLIMPGRFQDLLKGGLWGKAKFEHVLNGEYANINMNGFEAYQKKSVRISSYIKARKNFSTEQWIDVMIRTIGLDPEKFSREMKILYLARLIPIVEKWTNSLEIGPPQTGKSYLYQNISSYVRMLLGGDVSPAKLIFDQRMNRNGYVFTRDVLVFDEINKAKTKLNNIIPNLQQIMASNRVERGDLEASTNVSLIFQGNPIKNEVTLNNFEDFIQALPKRMYDLAFLDRIHRYIPGWKFHVFKIEFVNQGLGLVSNYFGQILHKLRQVDVSSLINENVKLSAIDASGTVSYISSRDVDAIKATLSGLIKIIYPDEVLTTEEWKEIADLSVSLRQNIIKEMVKLDPNQERTLQYSLKQTAAASTLVLPPQTITSKPASSIPTSTASSTIPPQVTPAQPPISVTPEIPSTSMPDLEDLRVIHPPLYINAHNQITRPVPYWILKMLLTNGKGSVNNSFFAIKTEGLPKFEVITEEKGGISLRKGANVNYQQEEEAYSKINQKLDNLYVKYRQCQTNLEQIENYCYVITRSPKFLQNEDLPTLLEKFEDLQNKLLVGSKTTLRKMKKRINSEKDGLAATASNDPDMLQYDFYPIILSAETRLEKLDELIRKWGQNHQQYLTLVSPLIKQATILGLSVEQLIKKSAENLFGGEKFAYFTFDMNNLHYSYRKMRDPTGRFRFYTPLQTQIKKLLLQNENFYATFFAGQHLKRYKIGLSFKGKTEWSFETKTKDPKGGKLIDVDSTLSMISGIFLEKYHSQIREFHIGSGDIDFHRLIEFAKEKNIPVKVIAVQGNSLSGRVQKMVKEVIYLS